MVRTEEVSAGMEEATLKGLVCLMKLPELTEVFVASPQSDLEAYIFQGH